MFDIRPVEPADYLNVSVLVTSAFRQANEERLLERLRAENAVAVELLAEDAGGIVGHVTLSEMRAPAGWLALGPVCVRTENAGQGIGTALVTEALDRARQADFAAAVVVGDPNWYRRFGFVFGSALTFETPYPAQYTGFYWFGPGPITAGPRERLVYPQAFVEA